MSLVARVWWCCCGVLCCLGGWWGPLVDVDDALGDFDAVGVMVCGVAVSTLGWGPGGWRWWRLFASRGGVLGVVVDGGALGVTLCRGRGGSDRGVVGDGTSVRRWWGWRWCVSWWSGGVGVFGVGAGWPACWCSVVRACRSWLVFGRLVVLVVSVVPSVGIFPSTVLGSVVTGVASVAV